MSNELSAHDPGIPVSPLERFERYLQRRGMRNTDQRRILVEFVFSTHDHFDADNLIDRLPRKGDIGYVSRPTVYRTLNEFVDAGLLRKFELDGRQVYEHDYGHPEHDHLYCTQCNQLFEFQSEALLNLRNAVAKEHSFNVSGHRLIVTGVCSECQTKPTQP